MIIHHSVRVKASAKDIYPMLLDWGAGYWWPEGSRIRCGRTTEGATGVGSRFVCRLSGPFGFAWDAEVISTSEDREVSRRLTGALAGVERLYIISGRVACEAHFLMDFEVAGGMSGIFWKLGLSGWHEAAVKGALSALRTELEGGNDNEEYPATEQEAERRRFLKSLIRR